MRKTVMLIGVVVVTVMAIGGLTVSSQQPKLTGSIALKGNDEAEYARMAKESLDDAVKAALQVVPGKVLEVELENEDGYLVYDVEILKADRQIVDVKIDAGTGKFLKLDNERNDGENEAKYAAKAKVSLDDAVKAALQVVPGKVLEVELENEDGHLVYGVKIVKTDKQIADVEIDAETGKLLKQNNDDNDDDDDEENSENEDEEGGER